MACRHPRDKRIPFEDGAYQCGVCNTLVTSERIKRGKNANRYGRGAELKAARKYGGTKTNDGGPVDIRGCHWQTQMRTRRTAPPAEWTKAFGVMPTDGLLRRLLIRYLPGPGLKPVDFFVVPGDDWELWYGRDV